MDVGVVAIKGLNSNYYLAISRKGEVYGAVSIQVRGRSKGSRYRASVGFLRSYQSHVLIFTSLTAGATLNHIQPREHTHTHTQTTRRQGELCNFPKCSLVLHKHTKQSRHCRLRVTFSKIPSAITMDPHQKVVVLRLNLTGQMIVTTLFLFFLRGNLVLTAV